MTVGSGIFSRQQARLSHLVRGGGLAGEVKDLREDINEELRPLAAIVVEEFVNPVGTAAPGTAALLAATATVEDEVTLTTGDLLAAGLEMLAAWPRQITFTTAGNTPADAPATATITGLDQYGTAQTETLNLAQTAATVTSAKYWSAITSIEYPAADGTDATVAIGIAAAVLKAATATVTNPVVLGPNDLIQNDLARHPRALVFTTAGATPADAPATATVKGKDVNGNAISETLALAQTGTTATTENFFAQIDSIEYPAGDGTGATIAITPSAAIGLSRKLRSRAGRAAVLQEVAAGTVVTNGTFTLPATHKPYGSYAPNTAANDANDYCIYYEYQADA